MYRNLKVEKQRECTKIKGRNLLDEMNDINTMVLERCKITLREILLGDVSDTKRESFKVNKKIGSP